MTQLFANNAITLSANTLSPTDTLLKVAPGTGAKFPTILNAEDYFLITLEDQHGLINEIVKCVNRNGDDFTIVRGQEGTLARTWINFSVVDLRETAETLFKLRHVVNSQFTLSTELDGFLRITVTEEFSKNTTQLWVGGLRQALGKDYIEESSTTIKMLTLLTENEVNEGQNVVLDFYRK